MRKVMAIAALGLIVCATAASAQGGGGRRGGGFGQGRGGFGGGGLMLLSIKEVQTELKMTEPQVAKIQPAQQAIGEKMRELFQGGGGGQPPSPEERQQRMAQMQEIQTKAVADILDTTQQKRFRQLELQQAGPNVILRKDVADELKITPDQQTKIQEAQRANQQAMMESFRNSGFDFQNATPEERQAFMKKIQDAQKASGEKLLTLLTDAQKTKFKEMQGAPFKFPENMGFGGPGGGRRPGGAGGNPPPA